MSLARPRLTLALTAAATLAAAALTTRARAQALHPLSFGISAGGAFLAGDDRRSWRDGFAAVGTLAVGFPVLPIQLRTDVGYQTFQGKFSVRQFPQNEATVGMPDLTVWSGTLSLVARPSTSLGLGVVRPFLTGGAGIYRTDLGRFGGRNTVETAFGLTGAVGASVPVGGLNAFFEARIHSTRREIPYQDSKTLRTYPVVAGFLF